MAVRAATPQVVQSLSTGTGAGFCDLRHTLFHDCKSPLEATVDTARQVPRWITLRAWQGDGLTSISKVDASVGMRPQAPNVTFPCCRATAPDTAKSSAVQQDRLQPATKCVHARAPMTRDA